ncbi:MAG: hypothetical protein AB1711_10635 [Thermodesulfobacteriota bacterium]
MSKPTRAERKEAKARDRERKQKRALIESFRAWECSYSTTLGRRIRNAYKWIAENIHEPSDLEGMRGDTLAGLYRELPMWEWGLSVLACGNDEEKYQLFKTVKSHERF